MADTNPSNFANRPKEEVQAIASMGGKKAHENAEKAKEVAAEASLLSRIQRLQTSLTVLCFRPRPTRRTILASRAGVLMASFWYVDV